MENFCAEESIAQHKFFSNKNLGKGSGRGGEEINHQISKWGKLLYDILLIEAGIDRLVNFINLNFVTKISHRKTLERDKGVLLYIYKLTCFILDNNIFCTTYANGLYKQLQHVVKRLQMHVHNDPSM
jgi:hypothetical protein